jgi:type IV pilus assembly protein PilC
VKPGPDAKRVFFHQLAQLLHAGIALPSALQKLERTAHGPTRALAKELHRRLESGTAAGDIFTGAPGLGAMESSVLNACARGGRLDQGCTLLAEHFDQMRAARATITQKLAYPLFVLHFGVFALALPTLLAGRGLTAYLQQTLGFLAALYVAAGALFFLGKAFAGLAAHNTLADTVLRALPAFGAARRSFALSRFCAIYEIQIEAGINAVDSLATAGAASRSALMAGSVAHALPAVRRGEKPGDLLDARVFTDELVNALRIGESSGNLDAELRRLADENRRRALGRVAMLSEWLPRLIYCAVLLYLGWQIISFYKGMFAEYNKLIDF